jgi:polar amino acid transport system substrate-binding protein
MIRVLRTSAAVLAAVLVAVVSGCGDSEEEGGASQAATPDAGQQAPTTLAQEGRLTMCADLSFPPMTYQDESSQPTGFDVSAAQAVADLWGTELEVMNMPFDGVLPALSSGRCDVAWTGINVTEERLKTFDAIPYLETGLVLLAKSGNPEAIDSPEALANKTAVTQSGTIYEESLRELAEKLGSDAPTIQTYPKMTDAIQQLVVGRADAVFTQDTEAAYRDTQQPGQFEVAYTFPEKDRFGVYFKKDSTEMRTALTAALETLSEDGTLAGIAEEHGLPAENLIAP